MVRKCSSALRPGTSSRFESWSKRRTRYHLKSRTASLSKRNSAPPTICISHRHRTFCEATFLASAASCRAGHLKANTNLVEFSFRLVPDIIECAKQLWSKISPPYLGKVSSFARKLAWLRCNWRFRWSKAKISARCPWKLEKLLKCKTEACSCYFLSEKETLAVPRPCVFEAFTTPRLEQDHKANEICVQFS